MTPTHEPWLVALSLAVAFQGSYIGLHLAGQIRLERGRGQKGLITGAALSLALGIWTMHFVGMLAAQLPVVIHFLALPTLLSFLVSVLVVGVAIYAVGTRPADARRTALASVFMGAGIVSMHYLGMSALHGSAHMEHHPAYVVASIVIGIAASGFALGAGFGEGGRRPLFVSAALMALAISAMHYTAMAGLTIHIHPDAADDGMPSLSPGLLAMIVSIVAFVVSGLFLLTLMPDATDAPGPEDTGASHTPAVPPVGLATDPALLAASAEGEDGEFATTPRSQGVPAATRLPVEKDGRKLMFELAGLVAVQAQAHYTSLYDGETTWFCPLPISEVEALLDPARFARVHRSHIINLDRVAAIRRSGDSDVVVMAGRLAYQAPVSRTRRTWLRQEIDRRQG